MGAFYGCEPLQIRRSDGLIMAQPPLPAELHKPIKQINGHSGKL
ncbi:hypothetical protein EUBSIR_00407 [[Eubacterium] siraeum DSM 15702]|uniref:Uncharacterized protein n=1 Tax=[Eubacterium] siraeum DSM 15702 TaxID=428128 RepID=B0MKR0_9FIRM|nr:hypothetical protein EUBSIR_00407 [[Eubacterium] siraeum DSM 15702]